MKHREGLRLFSELELDMIEREASSILAPNVGDNGNKNKCVICDKPPNDFLGLNEMGMCYDCFIEWKKDREHEANMGDC